MDLSLNSVTANDSYDIGNDKVDEENGEAGERTNLRSRSGKKDRIEKTYPKRIRKPLRSELAFNEGATADPNIVDQPLAAAVQETEDGQTTPEASHNVEHSKEEGENTDDLTPNADTDGTIKETDVSCPATDETKKMEGVDDTRSPAEGKVVTAGIPAVAHMQASVLHALGLTRGIGMGFTNTLNLGKSMSVIASEPPKAGLATSATTALPKTMPLLVNMKGSTSSGSGVVPSILPANLPPGRYVIISSTTAAATTPTSPLTTTTTHSTTNHTTITSSATAVSSTINVNPVISPVAVPSSTAAKSNRLAIIKNPVTSTPSNQRTHVGKTRGMRKSYTTSEKLAMIEAVESGLKKSVVADRFGVAPSTLACIILQKDKIRRDQSKTGLSRRRLRPGSSNLQFKQLDPEGQSEPSSAPDEGARGDGSLGATTTHEAGFRSPTGAGGAGAESRSPLPFTHFLANFDQSMAFDQAQAEEIVSVPDLTESLSYTQPDHAGSTHARFEASEDAVTSMEQSATASIVSPPRGAAVADQTAACHVTDVDSADDKDQETNRDAGYSSAATMKARAAPREDSSTLHQLQDPKIEVDHAQYPGVDDTPAPPTTTTTAHTATPTTTSGGGGGPSELSGLCLVKREVHCYSVLDQLMKDKTYTDVTLTADGHTFYAHKIVLCVASSYFRRVLNDNSPGVRNVIVLRDITHTEMRNLLQFLYTGEATVEASDLPSFMRTAQMLEINSLSDSCLAPSSFPSTSVSATAATFATTAQLQQPYLPPPAAPSATTLSVRSNLVNPQFSFSSQPTTSATPALPFGLTASAMRLPHSSLMLDKQRQALQLQQQLLQQQSSSLIPSLQEHSASLIVPNRTEMLHIPKMDKIYSEKIRRPGRRRKQPTTEAKVQMLLQNNKAQKQQQSVQQQFNLKTGQQDYQPVSEKRPALPQVDPIVPEILAKALLRTPDPRPTKHSVEAPGQHLPPDPAVNGPCLEMTSLDLSRPWSPSPPKSPKLCNGEQFKIKIRSVDSMTETDFDVAESVSSSGALPMSPAVPVPFISTGASNCQEGNQIENRSTVDCIPSENQADKDLISPPPSITAKGLDTVTDDVMASRLHCQSDSNVDFAESLIQPDKELVSPPPTITEQNLDTNTDDVMASRFHCQRDSNVDSVSSINRPDNDLVSPPPSITERDIDAGPDDFMDSQLQCQSDVVISEGITDSNCIVANEKCVPASLESSSHSQCWPSLNDRYQEDELPSKRRKIDGEN